MALEGRYWLVEPVPKGESLPLARLCVGDFVRRGQDSYEPADLVPGETVMLGIECYGEVQSLDAVAPIPEAVLKNRETVLRYEVGRYVAKAAQIARAKGAPYFSLNLAAEPHSDDIVRLHASIEDVVKSDIEDELSDTLYRVEERTEAAKASEQTSVDEYEAVELLAYWSATFFWLKNAKSL